MGSVPAETDFPLLHGVQTGSRTHPPILLSSGPQGSLPEGKAAGA
jgi:hypothetical protein